MDEPGGMPWAVVGEAVLALVPRPSERRPGRPLRRLPGRAVLLAARWQASPVGPFDELLVLEPARLGLRPGVVATLHVVSLPAARVALGAHWSLPAQPARIAWHSHAEGAEVDCDDRSLTMRAHAGRLRVPVYMPARHLSRGGPRGHVVPQWLRGIGRRARVEVSCGDSDHAWLTGSHAGLVFRHLRLVLHEPRVPLGLLSSFRVPQGAEPVVRQAARRSAA